MRIAPLTPLVAATRAALSLALIAGAIGCSKAEFNSQSSKAVAPVLVTGQCETDGRYTAEELVLGVKPNSAEIVVEGEFCPRAPADLTVLFVVDFSLSMYNAEKNRGNDPVVNGSCGRLDAAKALVAQYAQSLKPEDTTVKVGIVQFASSLVGSVPPMALADFPTKGATVANFCQGIDGTNYKIAFDSAGELLKGVGGTKSMFLLTDGLPTEGGGGARENAQRHRDAALAAMKALKAGADKLTTSTIFLGDFSDLGALDFNPQDFLDQLTGDAEHVKVAAHAEDLAKEILTLAPPKIALDLSTKKGVQKATGVADHPVAFATFEPRADQDPANVRIWTYRTDAFNPYPGTGAESSTFAVSVKDDKGDAYQVTFKIAPAAAGSGSGSGSPSGS